MSNQKNKKEHKLLNLIGGDKLILLAAIVVVFALFTCLNRNFLTWQNLVNLLVAASLVGIVAVGHTYLIIAGQNDLSPGSLALTVISLITYIWQNRSVLSMQE